MGWGYSVRRELYLKDGFSRGVKSRDLKKDPTDSMLETIATVNGRAMGSTTGRTKMCTRDSGNRARSMVMVVGRIRMAIITRVSG